MTGTACARKLSACPDTRGWRVILVILALYPVITLLTRPCVFFTAFDPETVTRFVEEFLFEGHATPGWAITESLRWGLTRPVYSMTFLSDFLLFGTDSRLYHATDFAIAWMTVCVLASTLVRSRERAAAWACLLIWMVMPSHAWSLYTFTGRNDRLAALFLLLAVREAAGWRNGPPGRLRQLLIPVFLLLGFLSKESAVACFVLPFAWLALVERWRVGSILRQTLSAWIPSALLPFACFGIRAALSVPLGDVGPLPGPAGCLMQLGRLVDQGLGSPGVIDPLVLGALSAASLSAAVLLRRLPSLARFGALVTLVSMIPFSFTWIQPSFHWLPSVGAALAVGGIVAKAGKPGQFHPARVAVVSALVLVYAWWGWREAGIVCANGVESRLAAMEAAARDDIPVDGNLILAEHPALAENLGYGPETDFQGQGPSKMRSYLEDLVQVELRNQDARIDWPPATGSVSR